MAGLIDEKKYMYNRNSHFLEKSEVGKYEHKNSSIISGVLHKQSTMLCHPEKYGKRIFCKIPTVSYMYIP